MMRFSASVSGVGRGRLARLGSELAREAVLRVARDVQRNVLANLSGTVLKVRTGSLRRAWARQPQVAGGGGAGGGGAGGEANVGSTLVYAAIHEFGGEIRPVRARFLQFKADDGRWVRTRLVTMPARRYASLAVAETERRVPRIVGEAVAAVAERLGLE